MRSADPLAIEIEPVRRFRNQSVGDGVAGIRIVEDLEFRRPGFVALRPKAAIFGAGHVQTEVVALQGPGARLKNFPMRV